MEARRPWTWSNSLRKPLKSSGHPWSGQSVYCRCQTVLSWPVRRCLIFSPVVAKQPDSVRNRVVILKRPYVTVLCREPSRGQYRKLFSRPLSWREPMTCRKVGPDRGKDKKNIWSGKYGSDSPLQRWPWRWWRHLAPTPSAKSPDTCSSGDPAWQCSSTPVHLLLSNKTGHKSSVTGSHPLKQRAQSAENGNYSESE